MSKGIVHTHAGDDSDGKIWGIEGVNILFMLAALLLGIGLAVMLSRQNPAAFSFGVGAVPFCLVTAYVLTLRQGKPKSFDTDLLETFATGTGWTPSPHQPRNPLASHAST